MGPCYMEFAPSGNVCCFLNHLKLPLHCTGDLKKSLAQKHRKIMLPSIAIVKLFETNPDILQIYLEPTEASEQRTLEKIAVWRRLK